VTSDHDLFRIYFDPAETDPVTGYPWQWTQGVRTLSTLSDTHKGKRLPDLVREQAGHRCVRCQHPFVVGETPGRWSPCDMRCDHGGPITMIAPDGVPSTRTDDPQGAIHDGWIVFAEWRVLTVHHLGAKTDCRWHMLVALCQRCHLAIQGNVVMERAWPWEHSEWFRPYAAAWYASKYLGEELTREQTIGRLDELLAVGRREEQIERMPI